MSALDFAYGVACLIVPLLAMLAAIAALTWTRREFVALLRRAVDRW